MTAFFQTALTFPTVVWSVLFAFCVVYWMLASTGLLDSESVDGWLGMDSDHAGTAQSAGILGRIGLSGVPVMVMLVLLAFIGWLVTYLVHLLVLAYVPAPLRPVAGLVTLVGAAIPAVALTSVLLRPLRPLFAHLDPPEARSLIGRVGQVTTPQVTARSGMAALDDGGAGLLLQVRSQPPDEPVRGDRVVLLGYDPADNSYLVISEDRFNV
ncbi:OB-fold-containig protein [Deinococcus malanensis]|uniref:OB-fold-containig protein n=1 Tax=Deinococcus malanensis TaxID=1706855 RepID=UPI00166A25F3|nr:OB-fold-containig protein [Deinococcus malanensis]